MDTTTSRAFYDELEKISSSSGEDLRDPSGGRVTKQKLKGLVRYGGAGALGAGVGYGVGKTVGGKLEGSLVRGGMQIGKARALRYALPILAATGAGLGLARMSLSNKMKRKILEDERRVSKRTP